MVGGFRCQTLPIIPRTEMLLGLGLIGLKGPDVRQPSGALAVWGGTGLGVTLGGLALGIGSGLESAGSAETAGRKSDFSGEKEKRRKVQKSC